MNLPVVAIVGRPNVGKSALFNRILGRRLAIVHEQPGVTRDRVAAATEFENRRVLLVDTGGLGVFLDVEKHIDTVDVLIREQVEAVLREAAVVILVTDAQDGLTPLDKEIAIFLRRQGRPVIVAANKSDDEKLATAATAAFTRLGFERTDPVSAIQGYGVGTLLHDVARRLPPAMPDESLTVSSAAAPLRIAIVGRPNVGKSSLVNALAGHQRMIVSDVPGTTRDAVDVPITLSGNGQTLPAIIVDTAGLRPKHKVDNMVERFSVMRTESAIKRADLVLFLVDGSEPPTAQDRKVGSLIGESRKCCLMVANKTDLLPRESKPRQVEDAIRFDMPFMRYAPIIPVSALKGNNLDRLAGEVLRVYEKMRTPLPTSILNQFLRDLVARTPPPSIKGQGLKLFYTTMVACPPPQLVLFVNHTDLGTRAYLQFLETRLSEAFFPGGGIPVKVELRKRPQASKEERLQVQSRVEYERSLEPVDPELSPVQRRQKKAGNNVSARRGGPPRPSRSSTRPPPGHHPSRRPAFRLARPPRTALREATRPLGPAGPG